MQKTDHIDDYMLGAFVDGELDTANCELVVKAMEQDVSVRERVYKLRRAKDLMHLGFAAATAPISNKSDTSIRQRRYSVLGLVASILFAVFLIGGGYLGYVGGKWIKGTSEQTLTATSSLGVNRILLHISESDSRQFAAALTYTRKFLDKHKYDDAQITVIANAGGLDLLRTGVSPYEDQIIRMMQDYNNVHFIACANSIRALRNKGIKPAIIADVDSSQPAMDQIIKHVQDGWSYIKVRTLLNS